MNINDVKKWLKPEKVGIDPISTLIWLGLFLLLWIVALIQISEADVILSTEILLLLSAGIGGYYAKKTSTDSEKEVLLKADTDEKVKTALGLRPRIARSLLALSLLLIYGFILIRQILSSDPITIGLFIEDEKFGIISTLFWAVIGFYAPNFHSLVKGRKD
ncbi:MAG: hypothetical protein ACFE9L_07945 [Candidatus Hodarchaeota archaeon]